MPTPTIIIPFGESSATGEVFAVVDLDGVVNVDRHGNELSEFIDSELVSILVHTESGDKIVSISTSEGAIINTNKPNIVTREYSNDEIAFKGKGDTYTLPHYPSSGVTVTWTGRERNVSLNGRKLTCNGGAGICGISYKYQSYQYILEVPNLNISIGDEFPVEVSFEINRNDTEIADK